MHHIITICKKIFSISDLCMNYNNAINNNIGFFYENITAPSQPSELCVTQQTDLGFCSEMKNACFQTHSDRTKIKLLKCDILQVQFFIYIKRCPNFGQVHSID